MEEKRGRGERWKRREVESWRRREIKVVEERGREAEKERGGEGERKERWRKREVEGRSGGCREEERWSGWFHVKGAALLFPWLSLPVCHAFDVQYA